MRPSQEVGEPHPRVALLFRFLENDAMCHRLVDLFLVHSIISLHIIRITPPKARASSCPMPDAACPERPRPTAPSRTSARASRDAAT